MAAEHRPRKPGLGVAVAAWLSVLLGVYAAVAVASLALVIYVSEL